MHNHSIANKLTRKVMLNVLVTMFIIVSIIFTITYRAIKSELDGRYEAIMDLVNEKLTRILASEEISARNLFDELYYSLDSPESVMKALEKEFKLNNYSQGYFMAFEPGYFPEYEKWFEPYMNKNDEHPRNIGSADHDYLTRDWYIESKKSEVGIWSDPYYDDVGAFANVCSLTMPIYDKRDSVVGVCGVDLSLNWLVNKLQDIDHNSIVSGRIPFDSRHDTRFHSFIINRDGTYLAHPDKERVMKKNVLAYINQHDEDDMDLYMQMMQLKRGQTTLVLDGVLATVYYAPLESTNWAMAIVVPQRVFLYRALVLVGLLLVVSIIGLAIIYYLCRSNVRRVAKPLSALARSTEEVAKGNFDAPLPVIDYQDEVCELRDSFATMQQSLEKYIEDIKQNTAREAALNHDLEVAWKIQKSMIPSKFPPFPKRSDIDLYGYLKPAKSVGGDLYDYFIRDDKLYFCIGDVSGKGIPAALVMVVIHYIFRIVSERYTNPKNIVEGMNEFVSAENKSAMFCTFFLGVLNLKTHELKYCNAGHEPPVLITSEVSMVPVDRNLPLGLIVGKSFKAGKMQLSPGDVLLLCTDGLKEAINQEEEIFGKERIIASLQKVVAQGPADVKACIHQLVEDAGDFVKDAPQADDLTLLAIKISNSS